MENDRRIDNPQLQAALNEVRATIVKYGFAGAVMLVAPNEGAYAYVLHAPWSAIDADENSLAIHIRANLDQHGPLGRQRRLAGAAHTVCQLADFGTQTAALMEQIKALLTQAGLRIDHTPFGGKGIPSLLTEHESAGHD